MPEKIVETSINNGYQSSKHERSSKTPKIFSKYKIKESVCFSNERDGLEKDLNSDDELVGNAKK